MHRFECRNAAPLRATRHERGITLVELMVAMTISLVILAVMSQIFLSTRTTYVVEEGLARVQESGRFALDTLAYDLRMAGTTGCVNFGFNQVNNNLSTSPTAVVAYDQAGIQGFRYVGSGTSDINTDWQPSLPSGFFAAADKVKAYGDVVIVKYAVGPGWALNNAAPNAATVQLLDEYADGNIGVGQVLMVTDCKYADIFAVQSLAKSGGVTTITPTTALKQPYSANRGGEVLVFTVHAYYLGDTGRNDVNGNDIPALFRKTVGANGAVVKEELVEGVEAMKIFYGVLPAGVPKVSGAPDRYVPASGTLDWSYVSSVRVGLVLSTLENVGHDATTTGTMDVVGLAGSTGENAIDDYNPPDDRRQRRGFTFVVQKRKPLR